MPRAENSGLIVPMTMLILREALQQAGGWQDEGLDVNLAVNISPRHLADVHLPDQLAAMLSTAGTARVGAHRRGDRELDHVRPGAGGEVLRRIRDLGIAVSIDDFGTGYSSLAYLRDLAATEVKIDKTFVLNASTSQRDLAIVKAAADLGHGLGLQVVAEGIEDDDDRAADGRTAAATCCRATSSCRRRRPPSCSPGTWRPRDWLGGQVVRLPTTDPAAARRRTRPGWQPTGDHPVGLPRALAGARRAARQRPVAGWAAGAGGTPGWCGWPWPSRSS